MQGFQIRFIRLLNDDTEDQFPGGVIDFAMTLDFSKTVNFT